MSECNVFVFAVVIPVLAHGFLLHLLILHDCNESFVSQQIFSCRQQQYQNTPFWMNDAQLFEAAFFGCAAVTIFILCPNTKKMRVMKSHWSIVLGFASNVTGLKYWTSSCLFSNVSKWCWSDLQKLNSVYSFAQSDMFEKMLRKLTSRLLQLYDSFFKIRLFFGKCFQVCWCNTSNKNFRLKSALSYLASFKPTRTIL